MSKIERLAPIIRENFPKYRGDVTRETRLSGIPGWDSVSHVAMLLDIEDAFGVTFPEERYYDFATVGDLEDAIDG